MAEVDPYPPFQQYAHPERLVSAPWLSARLGIKGLRVIEVDERVMADGKAVRGPDLEALEPELARARADGIDAALGVAATLSARRWDRRWLYSAGPERSAWPATSPEAASAW